MKRAALIVVGLLLVLGVGVGVMKFMEIGIFAPPDAMEEPEAEAQEPPNFIDLDPLHVTIFDGSKATATVTITVKLQTIGDGNTEFVRENLPRVKGTLAEIVNLSINQTLSRTVITSLTTLTTILVVLSFNFGTGNVLEGFMFALAVGVLSGTYSTIFIACPLLVWLEERARKKGERDVVAVARKQRNQPKAEGAAT